MKVGILNAYHSDKTPGVYQENYMPMFLQILNEQWPEAEVCEFKVAQGEFPASLKECAIWIITGSPRSAYDKDLWLGQLIELIRKAHQAKIKLLGLCFGHQIIAQALGGQVEKSTKGWGVGVREFEIIKRKSWMHPNLDKCKLLFSHQDQVIKIPDLAELLATDEFCPLQMFAIGEHIFCMQGHPEFTPEYARARLDTRIDLIGHKTYDMACKSLQQATNAPQVWQWIRNFSKAR